MSSTSSANVAIHASSAASTIYLGLDVHKESATIAVLPEGATAPTRVERLPNDFVKLRRFMDHLGKEARIRACYEASGATVSTWHSSSTSCSA